MSIQITIQGQNEQIVLKKDNIESVKYLSDTPNDSNARATDLSISVLITGKIISEEGDVTRSLNAWSKVPAESTDSYRNMQIEIISAGIMQRKITMPNTFIIDYEEEFNVSTGTGLFKMLVKQKKEKIKDIVVEGGYSA